MEDKFIPLTKCIILALTSGMLLAAIFQRYYFNWKTTKVQTTLLILSFLSVTCYFRLYTFHGDRVFHVHEQFHYVLNSKYFKELGYTNLYEAAIIADSETHNRLYKLTRIRDLDSYKFISRNQALEQSSEIKTRFSEERWAEFKQDVNFFTKIRNPNNFSIILGDKGYNAPPTWLLIPSVISNFIPISRVGLTAFALFDIFFIAIMFGAIYYYFGILPVLFSMIFFGCNYLSQFLSFGGAFFRLDWMLALILSVCFLKKGLYLSAGISMSFATLTRIFPVLFVIPVMLSLSIDAYRTRTIAKFAKFLVGFSAMSLLMLGLSVSKYSYEVWPEWYHKIMFHNSEIASKRVGLDYSIIYRGEYTKQDLKPIVSDGVPVKYTDRKQNIKSQMSWLLISIRCAFLIGMIIALWKAYNNHVSASMLGASLVPILLSPTRYYYVFLMIPVVILSLRIQTKGAPIILTLIFISAIFGYIIDTTPAIYQVQQFVQSTAMVFIGAALIIYIMTQKSNSTLAVQEQRCDQSLTCEVTSNGFIKDREIK